MHVMTHFLSLKYFFAGVDTLFARPPLTFIQGSIKECFQIYQVYEDDIVRRKVLGKFCGYSIPEPITTSANVIRMLFHSDEAIGRAGFYLTYSRSSQFPYLKL